MLLYVIYRWFKEKNEQIKYLILFVTGAGLACSSSYLFMVPAKSAVAVVSSLST